MDMDTLFLGKHSQWHQILVFKLLDAHLSFVLLHSDCTVTIILVGLLIYYKQSPELKECFVVSNIVTILKLTGFKII